MSYRNTVDFSTLKVTALEQFDPLAGTGNAAIDQAAFAAALAALAAGTYNSIQLAAKTYIVTGGVLPAGCSILGQGGDLSTLATVTDAPIVTIGGQDWLVQGVRFLGSGAGGSQIGIANGTIASQTGYARGNVINCTFDSLGEAGFLFFNAANPDVIHRGPLVLGCRIKNCPTFGAWIVFEYTRVVGCAFDNNGEAARVQAGNVVLASSTIDDNTVGVHIVAGGNDGHGVVADCDINHNTTNVLVDDALVNGMPFVGCNMFGGVITIGAPGGVGAKSVRFQSCTVDPASLNVFDNSVVIFDANLWSQGNANVITLAASAKVRFTEDNVDLNGQFPAILTAAFLTAPVAWEHDVQGFQQMEPVAAPAALAGSSREYVDAADGALKVKGTAGTITTLAPA